MGGSGSDQLQDAGPISAAEEILKTSVTIVSPQSGIESGAPELRVMRFATVFPCLFIL